MLYRQKEKGRIGFRDGPLLVQINHLRRKLQGQPIEQRLWHPIRPTRQGIEAGSFDLLD